MVEKQNCINGKQRVLDQSREVNKIKKEDVL